MRFDDAQLRMMLETGAVGTPCGFGPTAGLRANVLYRSPEVSLQLANVGVAAGDPEIRMLNSDAETFRVFEGMRITIDPDDRAIVYRAASDPSPDSNGLAVVPLRGESVDEQSET